MTDPTAINQHSNSTYNTSNEQGGCQFRHIMYSQVCESIAGVSTWGGGLGNWSYWQKFWPQMCWETLLNLHPIPLERTVTSGCMTSMLQQHTETEERCSNTLSGRFSIRFSLFDFFSILLESQMMSQGVFMPSVFAVVYLNSGAFTPSVWFICPQKEWQSCSFPATTSCAFYWDKHQRRRTSKNSVIP